MENNEKEPKIEITVEIGDELDLLNFESGLVDAIFIISRELKYGSQYSHDPQTTERAFCAIETAATVLNKIHSWKYDPESTKILAKVREAAYSGVI